MHPVMIDLENSAKSGTMINGNFSYLGWLHDENSQVHGNAFVDGEPTLSAGRTKGLVFDEHAI